MTSFVSDSNSKTLDSLVNVDRFDTTLSGKSYIWKKTGGIYTAEEISNNVKDEDLDMNGFKIINLGDPTNPTDATNKEYVDDIVGNYLPLSGGVISGKLGVQSGGAARGIIQAGPRAMENNNMSFDIDCPLVANSNILNTVPGKTPFLLFSRPGENFVTYDTTGMFTVNHYENTAASKTELGIDLYEDDMIPGVLPVTVLTLQASGNMNIIGPLNLDDKNITGVSLPVDNTDVANKQYVDNKVGEIGNGELDMHNFKIVNLGDPVNNSDAANKEYVDKPVDSDLDMNGFKINELGDPVNNTDATNKIYVDNKFGEIGNSDLDMNGFKIVNLGTPVNNADAANKEYVDKPVDSDLDMNGFKIIEVGDPVDNTDAVNKQYVDNNFVNVTGDVMSGTLGVGVTNPIQGILQVGNKASDTANNHLDDNCPIVANLDIINDPLGRSPMICLNRSGINTESYGNVAVFALGRYEDVGTNSRSSLGLGLAHGQITAGSTIPEVITFKSSGEIDMVGPLNLDTQRITGVDTPIDNNDAANKEYVDKPVDSDLDMNGFKIVELGDPVDNTDAVNKQYADGNYVNVIGDVMSGTLGVDVTEPIQGILQVGDKHVGTSNMLLDNNCPIVANLEIANDPLGRSPMVCLNRSGVPGQSYGNVALLALGRYENVGSNSRSSLALELAHGEITPGSTLTEVITFKSSGEIDMIGPLNLDTKRITGIDTPVDDNDAVNKLYVDNLHPLPALEYNLDNLNSDRSIMYNVGTTEGQYDLSNNTPWDMTDGKLYSNGSSQYSGLVDFEAVGVGLDFQFFFVCQFLKNRNEKSLNDYTIMFEYQQIRLSVPFRYDENNNTWEINYKYGNANEFNYSSTGVFYNDEVVLWSVRQDGTTLKVMASTVSGTLTLISENLTSYNMSGDDNLCIGGGSLTPTDFPSFFFYHLSTYPRSMTDKMFNEIRQELSAKWIARYPSGRTNDYICDQLINQNVNAFSYNYIDFFQDPMAGIEYTFLQPGLENTFNCYLTGRYSVSIYFSGLSTGFGEGTVFLARDGVILGTPEVNSIYANFTVPAGAMDNRQAIISVNDDLQLFNGSNYGVMIWFNANGTFDGRATLKIKYIGPMSPVSYY